MKLARDPAGRMVVAITREDWVRMGSATHLQDANWRGKANYPGKKGKCPKCGGRAECQTPVKGESWKCLEKSCKSPHTASLAGTFREIADKRKKVEEALQMPKIAQTSGSLHAVVHENSYATNSLGTFDFVTVEQLQNWMTQQITSLLEDYPDASVDILGADGRILGSFSLKAVPPDEHLQQIVAKGPFQY